jgi:3-oxoacyl-[acyl-carrier protein] reductase
MNDLREKVCLVTGASTGIGAAVARALGGHGASVAVHYHRSADQASES